MTHPRASFPSGDGPWESIRAVARNRLTRESASSFGLQWIAGAKAQETTASVWIDRQRPLAQSGVVYALEG